jgi:hypothetical protein
MEFEDNGEKVASFNELTKVMIVVEAAEKPGEDLT